AHRERLRRHAEARPRDKGLGRRRAILQDSPAAVRKNEFNILGMAANRVAQRFHPKENFLSRCHPRFLRQSTRNRSSRVRTGHKISEAVVQSFARREKLGQGHANSFERRPETLDAGDWVAESDLECFEGFAGKLEIVLDSGQTVVGAEWFLGHMPTGLSKDD